MYTYHTQSPLQKNHTANEIITGLCQGAYEGTYFILHTKDQKHFMQIYFYVMKLQSFSTLKFMIHNVQKIMALALAIEKCECHYAGAIYHWLKMLIDQ